MDMERKKFRDVFKESPEGNLSLLIKVKVKEEVFDKDVSFGSGERLGGVDFHKFRYLDIAGKTDGQGVFEILGFYPQS